MESMTAGNIITGIVIGLGVDAMTGAMKHGCRAAAHLRTSRLAREPNPDFVVRLGGMRAR
jgi:hypothetical protein